MAIYAAPGATFEAALDATTGLSPTVAIYNTPAGTTMYGPSATGVTEFPAGSGLYAVTLTAPTTQGGYSVVWAFGGQYAREELLVTFDLPSSTPSSDSFISVQDLTAYLGQDVSAEPGAIAAVDAACAICRTIAEQDFTRGTTTASYDGTGTDALLLPKLPVLNAGTVTVNGGTVTDYMLNGNGILLRGTAGIEPRPTWPLGRQNVSVTYEHGYDTVDVPEDVRQIAINIAARTVMQGLASDEQIGDVRVKYAVAASDLSPTEKLLLRKHRQAR